MHFQERPLCGGTHVSPGFVCLTGVLFVCADVDGKITTLFDLVLLVLVSWVKCRYIQTLFPNRPQCLRFVESA